MKRLLSLAATLVVSAGPVYSETLQGGIEHSDFLQPVSSIGSLAPQGSQQSPTMLQSSAQRYGGGVSFAQARAQAQQQELKQQKMVEWFQIPKWMAGTWSKQGDTTVSATDLHSGYTERINKWTDNRMTVAFGHQMDRSGSIWQANILPAETDSISGAKSVRFIAVSRKCESFTPEKLITRTHYVVTETLPMTGQVCDQFQQESLNSYSFMPDGELVNNSSNRVFTANGQAVRDGLLESKFNRIANFAPKPVLDGVDLGQTFKSFLVAMGRPDLVP